MKVAVEQRHIDAGMDLSTAHPFALAIKEELDKRAVPTGYLRVERVVSVSSSVTVIEHRIIKRKGREETDLAWEKYWFGEPTRTTVNGKTHEAYHLNDPAFDFMVVYGMKQPVQPIVINLTRAADEEDAVCAKVAAASPARPASAKAQSSSLTPSTGERGSTTPPSASSSK